jgi:hypothetical protein
MSMKEILFHTSRIGRLFEILRCLGLIPSSTRSIWIPVKYIYDGGGGRLSELLADDLFRQMG